MAITPAEIIGLIKTIGPDTIIDHFMNNVYAMLPNCINRAVATLQCTQLEREYKSQVDRLKAEYNFDLHSHIQQQVANILKRPR